MQFVLAIKLLLFLIFIITPFAFAFYISSDRYLLKGATKQPYKLPLGAKRDKQN